MLSMYPACFCKEREGGYSVLFPDFPCGTCGDDLNEAMQMAVDFLAGQLYDLKLENTPYPRPTDISKVDPSELCDEDDYESFLINMVTVDVDEYAKKHFEKSVRKNCTIPSWLNDMAEKEHINFSAVLREALEAKLNVR